LHHVEETVVAAMAGWKALDEEGPIRYPAPSSSGADKRESWKVKLE